MGDTPDAADDWIAAHVRPGDITVTQDIPLAQRCLAAGGRAVSPRGHTWTEANIGVAIAGRDLARHLRELGCGGGPPAFATAETEVAGFVAGIGVLAVPVAGLAVGGFWLANKRRKAKLAAALGVAIGKLHDIQARLLKNAEYFKEELAAIKAAIDILTKSQPDTPALEAGS